MVIKGTVHNGQIRIESDLLPEGTQVLITPIQTSGSVDLPQTDLEGLKAAIQRIAALDSENECQDGFSGADHDKVLYGK